MNRTRNTYSESFPSSSSRLFALRQQALCPVLATMVEIEVEAESVLRFTSKNVRRTKLSSHNIQPLSESLDVLPPNSHNLIRIPAVTVLNLYSSYTHKTSVENLLALYPAGSYNT